eukprot:761987-Hanusia_phi.AAC.4
MAGMARKGGGRQGRDSGGGRGRSEHVNLMSARQDEEEKEIACEPRRHDGRCLRKPFCWTKG